ncbi:MAG: hypothetical protein AAFX41_15530, partial [Bacteroidota bacterium]
MEEEFVVLRAEGVEIGNPSTRDVFLGPLGSPLSFPSAPPTSLPGQILPFDPLSNATLSVESIKIQRRDLPEVTADPTVLGAALNMPMKLIEPVESMAVESETEGVWGIQAVRADTSPFDGEGVVVAVLDT